LAPPLRSPVIIGSDKTKTQTYCEIDDLSEQLIQAVQEKDRKKANALAEKNR
jgi:ABC-type transporter Mla subunit MlaD